MLRGETKRAGEVGGGAEGVKGFWELGGRCGRVCAYVPGHSGSYGRGKMGDERETVKVWGAWGSWAGLRKKRTNTGSHRAQTHSRG